MLQQLIVTYIGVKDTGYLTSLSPDLVLQKLPINRGKEGQKAPRNSWCGVEVSMDRKASEQQLTGFSGTFDVIDQCHSVIDAKCGAEQSRTQCGIKEHRLWHVQRWEKKA